MKLRVLDLFSGTQSVKKALDERWPHWEYTSLDLANADINTDIMDWDYQNAYPPNHFDIIWASPVCTYFSRLRRCNIGQNRNITLFWLHFRQHYSMCILCC